MTRTIMTYFTVHFFLLIKKRQMFIVHKSHENQITIQIFSPIFDS
jgi:hypothetical protein